VACEGPPVRPAGFDHEEFGSAWSHWVLEHGLPELPGPQIAVGESVPVAYWVGPTTAAVLHIRRWQDEDEPEQEPWAETDIALFRRVGDLWEECGGGGAGGWGGEALTREQVPARTVCLDGKQESRSGEQGCTALWGEVGADAAVAEVEQSGTVTRRRVQAPTGFFVVSAEAGVPFTVRVFDSAGELLAEIADDATPPWDPWMR
jgi:hypothetical protein